ncbi:hypothetical protein PHLGIDRAFT_128986 [Phlebiopsis gigantea 11061_1 CR5-6]|uniref:Uncharacterized protein n=1 Tax=Phlebiopsis gigantea (strain 11061_1 CR5-6) TaxID=745531 RepID=A0A0C3S504_PHLG1|nr:hypothetical protein PHLGIDRAFT_128986 [Phlebiopsis gigantea 11061_1 CR5-6]
MRHPTYPWIQVVDPPPPVQYFAVLQPQAVEQPRKRPRARKAPRTDTSRNDESLGTSQAVTGASTVSLPGPSPSSSAVTTSDLHFLETPTPRTRAKAHEHDALPRDRAATRHIQVALAASQAEVETVRAELLSVRQRVRAQEAMGRKREVHLAEENARLRAENAELMDENARLRRDSSRRGRTMSPARTEETRSLSATRTASVLSEAGDSHGDILTAKDRGIRPRGDTMLDCDVPKQL